MKQLMKYWKQLLGVVIVLVVSVIGVRSLAAVNEGISISRIEPEVNQLPYTAWTVDHVESFMAVVTGSDPAPNPANVKWESSDPDVIMVSASTGERVDLTAVGAGSSRITATYDFGGGVIRQQTIEIIVKLEVTNQFQYGFLNLEANATGTVYTNSRTELDWTVNDPTVVEITSTTDGNAIVKALAGGSTYITGRTKDGTQHCTVDVIVRTVFSDKMTSGQYFRIDPGEYIPVTDDMTNALSKNVTMASSNPNRLQVSAAGLRGERAGHVLLYAYPKYDWSKTEFADADPSILAANFGSSVEVIVNFGITNGKLTMAVGDTVQMETNVEVGDEQKVNWTSSSTNVVSVDAQGKLTANASGTANITATLDDPDFISGDRLHYSTVEVTVIDSFAISETEHLMNVGESFELYVIATDHQNAQIDWSSTDESVASFVRSEDGHRITVTGNKKGTAVIKAIQTINGVKKIVECQVSVNEPVGDIILRPTELELNIGEVYSLNLTFNPPTADNKLVRWVSSDESIATVDEGVITAVGGGDCTISVVTLDGIKVASCKLHVRIPVTGIRLSQTQVTCSLSLGTYQLSYYIEPEGNGVNTNVVWESSNPEVLTVDKNGFVTFHNPGNATVICQTEDTGVDGINLVATCDFVIEQPVTKVTPDFTDITLKIGEQFRLTALVEPGDATNKELVWISSNESIVTVDETGLLTAVAGGDAAILVQSVDSGVTALCNVKVYQPVTSVTISNATMEVRKGTEFWLHATALPSNADNPAISWSTANSSIATVDQTGKVTTLASGETIITATSVDTGEYATCKLTVLEPVTGISLNITSTSIYKNSRFVLIPTVTPIDADNKSVTWTSSDPDIASVDNNGVVTGLKGGKCIILATTVERGLVASCEVEVWEFIESIKINGTTGNINYGETRILTAEVTPETATNLGVVWSSSNPSVLQITERGLITAVGYGTATIYATAADGSGVYDSAEFRCIKPVTSINVSQSYVTMLEGNTVYVTATVNPPDATIREIKWTSSDESIAFVDLNGGITGVKAGICYVYATSTDGNNVVATIKVTVRPLIPATSVSIGSGSQTLLVGQNVSLKYRVKPSNSTDNVEWMSSDPYVATVNSNGVVTAVGQGNCQIYCVSSSGAEGVCDINVLAMNATRITVEQYDSYNLDVFGSTGRIRWYSDNLRVATVSNNGTVIGRKPGTTTITARVNGKVLTCTVTVTKMPKLQE